MIMPYIKECVEYAPAEHEVFLSFYADADAVLFREWWAAKGSRLFAEWGGTRQARGTEMTDSRQPQDYADNDIRCIASDIIIRLHKSKNVRQLELLKIHVDAAMKELTGKESHEPR